jgi:hypothetical protein
MRGCLTLVSGNGEGITTVLYARCNGCAERFAVLGLSESIVAEFVQCHGRTSFFYCLSFFISLELSFR